jgi:hypothetical protein
MLVIITCVVQYCTATLYYAIFLQLTIYAFAGAYGKESGGEAPRAFDGGIFFRDWLFLSVRGPK